MGEEQRIAYERQLEKAMESLLEFPEWGMVTNDVGTGIRAVSSHAKASRFAFALM